MGNSVSLFKGSFLESKFREIVIGLIPLFLAIDRSKI